MSDRQSFRHMLLIFWLYYIQYPIQDSISHLIFHIERRFYPSKPVVELTRDDATWVEYVTYDQDGIPQTWGNPYSADWMTRKLLEDGTTSPTFSSISSGDERWRHLRGPKIIWPESE